MTAGKIPRDVSGQELRKALTRVVFQLTRQRGSHMVLFRFQRPTTLVVPDHKVLKVGLLRKLVDQAGLTIDEFLELLR